MIAVALLALCACFGEGSGDEKTEQLIEHAITDSPIKPFGAFDTFDSLDLLQQKLSVPKNLLQVDRGTIRDHEVKSSPGGARRRRRRATRRRRRRRRRRSSLDPPTHAPTPAPAPAPAPTKIAASCNITVEVLSQRRGDAATTGLVTVSLEVNGEWITADFFKGIERNAKRRKHLSVQGAPSKVKLSIDSRDTLFLQNLQFIDDDGRRCDLGGRGKRLQKGRFTHLTFDVGTGCKNICAAPRFKGPYFVNPLADSSGVATGQPQAPFPSVSECAALATSSKRKTGDITWPIRCQLKAARYTERVELTDVKHLTIEADEGQDVIFDGTEVLANLSWSTADGVSKASIAHVAADRRAALIVAGESIQCAPSTGGAAVLNKLGECFRWRANEAWPVLFKKAAAEHYFKRAFYKTAGKGAAPSPFWYDPGSKMLYVQDSAYNASRPTVRVKTGRAGIYFTKGGAKNVTLKNLKFFGSKVGTVTSGWTGHSYLRDITLERNRFLYHPSKIHVETTKRRGRGAGKFIHLLKNTFEFGEGALYFVGSRNLIEENYLAFNSIEKGGGFLFDSLGIGDVIKRNTGLYNGNSGGVRTWSKGYSVLDNLILAPNVGQKWHDTAQVHCTTGSQYGLLVKGNWFLGISRTVKSVRFDTSKSTTEAGMGRNGTVVNNVFFGLDALTIKGDRHRIVNNTGDKMNIVTQWAAIRVKADGSGGMNKGTDTVGNAVSNIFSRGAVKSKIPGNFTANACQRSDCLPLPQGGVCAALRNCRQLALALKEGLVKDLSVFDFRPKLQSKLRVGAYTRSDGDKPEPPGVPIPSVAFPTIVT